MISDASLQFFFTTLNTVAGKVYEDVPIKSPAFSTTVPTGEAEDWKTGWIGLMDKMRPWDGPRVTEEPAPQTYSVRVVPFEQTRKLDRFRFDDDSYGIYSDVIPRMARQAKRAQDFEIRNLLQAKGKWAGINPASGVSYQNGWDGLSFFNSAHPVDLYDAGKGSYSNDFTGGGSTQNGVLVGGGFNQTSVLTLWEYMTSIKGEDGEPLEIESDTILIPSTLKGEAEVVLNNLFYAPPTFGTLTGQVGAMDNALKRFGLKYIDWALLNAGSSTTWYMMATTHVWKPILWLLRQAPVWTYLINEQSPNVFNEHALVWGVWARWAPAWAISWLMARSGP